MDPAFWNNLPAIIAAAVSGVTAIIATVAARRIGHNTQVTIAAKDEVVNKVESATKEVNEQATMSAKVATNAVIKNTEATKQIIAQNQTISNKTNQIDDRLNGGPNGLTTLTLRVAALESNHSEMSKGLSEVVKSVDRLSNLLERK